MCCGWIETDVFSPISIHPQYFPPYPPVFSHPTLFSHLFLPHCPLHSSLHLADGPRCSAPASGLWQEARGAPTRLLRLPHCLHDGLPLTPGSSSGSSPGGGLLGHATGPPCGLGRERATASGGGCSHTGVSMCREGRESKGVIHTVPPAKL